MPDYIEIAHRGFSINEKDNSIASFRAAIDNKFDMIELDVQLCKTNEIVILHDRYLEGRFVCDMTLEEIKEYDNDIITIEELFAIDGLLNLGLYFDLKGEGDIVGSLFCVLNNNREINKSNIWIASFNYNHVTQLVAKRDSQIKIGLITSNILTNDIIETFYQLDFISIDIHSLTGGFVDCCKNNGLVVFSYTCRKREELPIFLSVEIDGIITNDKINL
uniref:GP-PDE domain-containing protein n=1 Tax=viral metagenome TaxID=1070528 RepID=A0A6C0LIT0_9ZZZZ